MSDSYAVQANSGAMTELRRRIRPEDNVLPVMSTNALAPAGRVRLVHESTGAEELVRYTGFGVDAVGMPTLTGCTRAADREQGGSAAREWPGGSYVVQAPYERPELVSELPAATADQAGRTVYLDQREPALSFYDQEGAGRRDLTTPERWPAAFRQAFGAAGLGNGQFGEMRGIAVDGSGNVYVSSDNRIQKFTANGTYTSTIATAGSGNGQVNAPSGLVWHETLGTLLAVDTGNHRVQEFNGTTGAYIAQFGAFGAAGNQFDTPVAILNSKSGTHRVYVLDRGNGALKTWSKATGSWAHVGTELDDYYDGGRGMAVEHVVGSDHVFVTNDLVHQVRVDRGTGQIAFAIGSQGGARGEFNQPYGIARDRQGNIYVVDSGNHRVQVFDANGVFQGAFGEYGTGNGEFDGPTAIAVTDDYIYVADSGNSRVQLFSNPTFGRSFTVGEASTTWAPAAVAANSATLTTVTVPGAATGDFVEWSHTGELNNANVVMWAKVTSTNTVAVFLVNNSAASATLSSGTLRVRVTR